MTKSLASFMKQIDTFFFQELWKKQAAVMSYPDSIAMTDEEWDEVGKIA